MLRKALSSVPGLAGPASGRFFYPRHGYGQIAEAYARAARVAGAEIHLNSHVRSIETATGAVREVVYEQEGQTHSLAADHVWSTIPVTALVRSLSPTAPPEVLRAAGSIEYRGMILVYLVLEQSRFTEYDAHYFPELHIPITRVSEPKNYSGGEGPENLTVLCAELPCEPNGPEWLLDDEALGRLVAGALDVAGLPVRAPIKEVVTRRLRQAYPIYRRGYEAQFGVIDHWLSGIGGLLTFGRQGLFAHDNTHHALYMAYAAAACLGDHGVLDRDRWRSFRQIFENVGSEKHLSPSPLPRPPAPRLAPRPPRPDCSAASDCPARALGRSAGRAQHPPRGVSRQTGAARGGAGVGR
jgi:protoporphyrinogen oxidase